MPCAPRPPHAYIARQVCDPDGNPLSLALLRHLFAHVLAHGTKLAAADLAQGDASFATRGALWRTIFTLSTGLLGKLPHHAHDASTSIDPMIPTIVR